ncbi:MAG: Hpt domain-containing protein [Lachnospiraceae bacterium]|nr:Hpt domain-containing protein [Lachnospiraceae bacterium]
MLGSIIEAKGLHMDVETLKRFTDVGMKPEEAIYRFLGKEDIYKKFLKKYLADTGIDSIRQSLEKKDAYEVFKAAHTLKGVAANLGLEIIQNKASEITECTREKTYEEFDIGQLERLIAELEDCNSRVCEVIEGYCQ